MTEDKFRLDNVDVSNLETEADFRREAERLLPAVLVQVGESSAKLVWKQTQDELRRTGIKPNLSSIEKQRFVREAGEEYRRKASAEERRDLIERIVQDLRGLKKKART